MAESNVERNRAIRVIKLMLFSASVIPALLAGAISFHDNIFNTVHFILLAVGLFIGQAGGDYLYYYFTHFHTDNRDSHTKIFAGWKPLFTDTLFQSNATLWVGILCLIIDLAIGVYFTLELGYIILLFALAGGLVAIFFTPLMIRGYKEPVIFVTFGPLCVLGVYFALAQNIPILPILASLPIAFFVTVVAHLKGAHFEVKSEGGELVIMRLNHGRILWMFIAGYLLLIGFVSFSLMPFWTILGLLSFPLTFSVLKTVRDNKSKVSDYLWAVVKSILILDITGLLISLGFLIKH